MPVSYPVVTCPRCAARGTALEVALCPSCGECAACCARTGSRGCRGSLPHRNARREEPTFHGEPTALFPRYVGVEMEMGLTDLHGGALMAALNAWNAQAVSDASIGLSAGVEVVSAPARGADAEAQIADLCGAAKRHGAKVDKSTGLHCHVDARGASYADLCRLARLYSKVESGIFNMIAPSRRKNRRFCQPWGATFDRAGVFLAESVEEKTRTLDVAIYGSEAVAASAKRAGKYHASRYKALNLHAFHCHGTVEFRMHHGTVDPVKVTMWAAVCVALVDFAFRETDETIGALRGTPAEILDRVVASPTVRAWMRARREHFAVARSRTGAPPRRRAPAAPASPLPVVEAGPAEGSEV
jgi:hypothetical protein